MHSHTITLVAAASVMLIGAALQTATAQPARLSSTAAVDYADAPVSSVEESTPLVMLTLSRDHQLYYAAYNDYSDLDGDGVIEISYKHSFDYYGYFDPQKCYDYDASDERFEPRSVSSSKYCDSPGDGQWSGNFLNWASMSRMDIVRKLLYGGMRSTDTGSRTVLERAFIPMDAHAFTKYYDGADYDRLTPMGSSQVSLTDSDLEKRGFTICNMTWAPDSENSHSTTRPPLLRIAKGNYTLWNAGERHLCNWTDDSGSSNGQNANDPARSGINAFSDSPKRADSAIKIQGGDGDYVARVQACVSGLQGTENCKRYPSGNLKPIGLLQSYGDENLINFGLLTGSYDKNISGGVVRKNILSFNDEVRTATNGTFVSPINDGSIVETINALRMYGYDYDNRFYNNLDNCGFQLASITEGDCSTWGNPLSEMYLETVRYMAGQSPTAAFAANDSSYLSGLDSVSWKDPLNNDNYCAQLSTIVFNASVNDYDDDALGGISDIGATRSVAELTNRVGAAEGINGGTYFVGSTAANKDEQCSAKTVAGLGDVKGICPEAPTKQGTFGIAGIAHYARTNDIRPGYPASGPGIGTSQLLNTYAVALAPAVPNIVIPVPGSDRSVALLPAYRNLKNPDQPGGGALVAFRIVESHSESGGTGTAKFYVNWEDSEQGGDHDQDVWGTLEYEVTSSQITITTEVVAESTSTEQLFGYIISGTTKDGFHAHSGIQGANFTDPTGVLGCTNCRPSPGGGNGAGNGQFGPQSVTYKLGDAQAELLQPPLFYAAKYGGFFDRDSSGDAGFNLPDKQEEWDQFDTNGVANPDGIPDNYFPVSNPAALEDALRRVFNDIVARSASGTAAAVLANSREGQGAVYQALYEPLRNDNQGREARWIGTVHALWVDENGRLREDDGDATLEGFASDPAIELFFDETIEQVRFRRFTGSPESTTPSIHALDELRTIWNGREQLSAVPDNFITSQRVYNTTAADGRHIITFLDFNRNGIVEAGEAKDFVPTSFSRDNYGVLNTKDGGDAIDLINYIRGAELPAGGFGRNRTLDFDNDGIAEVQRLGDVVNSTPTVVGAPAEAFDLLYDDATYDTFRSKYAQRRNVVYVGANDGMLHAFNAGCFDPSGPSFTTNGGLCTTDHPLGAELWAYVPFNLLPHLRWFAEPEYPHVNYVDGKPRVFDARIFTPDDDHPGGWGTVLVVGFRFGGADLTIPANATTSDFGASDLTTRSAYVVLDITNPEKPPKVLAEITHPKLGFATSFPTVVAVASRGTTSGNLDASQEGWYLVFGNGPTSLAAATSNQNNGLFAFDLKKRQFVTGYAPLNIGEGNGFVGDPVTVDWNLDFKADAMYFGTATGTAASPGGSVFKLGINGNPDPSKWAPLRQFLDVNRPVTAAPAVTTDSDGGRWVLGGSGRFFRADDKSSTARQTLFGVLDPDDIQNTGSESQPRRSFAQLVDVSNARVATTGVVDGVAGVSDQDSLEAEATDKGGWKLQLDVTGAAERVVTPGSTLGDTFFVTAFTPSTDLCAGEGSSRLFGVFFKTGAARAEIPVFGTRLQDFAGNQLQEAIRVLDLGTGLGASPSLHLGSGRDSRGITVLTQTSTGAIDATEGDVGAGIRSDEIDWQENETWKQ